MTFHFFASIVASAEWPNGWKRPFYYTTLCCCHSAGEANFFYHFSLS